MDEKKLYVENLSNAEKEQRDFVVYDQSHWNDPDHIEYVYHGYTYDMENYNFLKMAHPDKTLGIVTKEYFKQKLKKLVKYANN